MRVFYFRFIYIAACTFAIFFFSSEVLSKKDETLNRIKKMEKRMEKTRKELSKGEKKLRKLKSDEKKTLAELDLSEKKIEIIHKNLRIIKGEERTLKGKINVAQNNYEHARKNFKNRIRIYRERLRSMYKRQRVSPIGMLFTAGSISSVLRGFKLLALLAEADLNVVNDMRRQTQAIESSLNQLNMALKAKTILTKTKRREKTLLSHERKKKRKILEEIKRDEKLQEARIKKYREELKKSEAELNKAIRERERAKIPVPVSLKGYNFAQHKGKLPWPVRGKVVSRFGKVIDPKTKTTTQNRGIEIMTKHGAPVSTIGSGQVVMTQWIRGYGNFVMISHPPDYYTIYGHLSDILVKNDDVVFEGDVIGQAGSTGMIDDSSSRLVLEVLKGEKPENPLNWLKTSRLRAGK